jgi:predicted AAA+ superfamily ATPase
VFLRLSREPGRLRAELAAVDPASGPVIIDEIQKLPGLLDDGLRRIADETALRRRIVVCTESAARVVDGIEIFPVRQFLHALWTGDLIDSCTSTPAHPQSADHL